MTTIKSLSDDNVRYLEQARALLTFLSDDQYAGPAPMNLGSSVGAHLRHCLDHFDNFLSGAGTSRIDYDARRRDVALELSRSVVIRKVDDVIHGLQAISSKPDVPVMVKMDCGGAQNEQDWWTDSSIRRELQFLISHTVHHFAIMKMVLIAGGVTVDQDFGMAPSTLRYHQGASSCAH